MGRLVTCLDINGQIFREDDMVEVTRIGDPDKKIVGRIVEFVRRGEYPNDMIYIDTSAAYYSSDICVRIDQIDAISFHY